MYNILSIDKIVSVRLDNLFCYCCATQCLILLLGTAYVPNWSNIEDTNISMIK